MKHLFKAWNEIEGQLKAKDVLLFLDYDGTLTPITDFPFLAQLSPPQKTLLRDLLPLQTVTLAIVSGRSLNDVKELIDISGLIYAGNHGLEVEGPGIHYVHAGALNAKKLLENITLQLETALGTLDGIFVENKVLTLSVHYRQLQEQNIDSARTLFFKIIYPYLEKFQVVLTEGKKVWEVRPAVEWNKGKAVLWLYDQILEKSPSDQIFAIYLGDDWGDEAAFKALKYRGAGVRVTENPDEPSHADYFLSSPDEVLEFLNRLKGLKTKT
ncbi:MAG: trehalose-phosphatase [Candidatus Omnitrophica bacterium]|nr:trehalose-phosphatase [Candidatus Omnitrophota bacterium]